MQRDTQFTKSVGEQDQVTEVARESIKSPHDDVTDVPGLDGREEFLQARSLHVLA